MKILETDEELLNELNEDKPKTKKEPEPIKELDEDIEEEMEEQDVKPIIKKQKPKVVKTPKENIGNFMIEVLFEGNLITRKYSQNPIDTITRIYNSSIELDNGRLLKLSSGDIITFNVVRLE